MENQEYFFCGNCLTTYPASSVERNNGLCPGCSMPNLVEVEDPIDAVNGGMENYLKSWQEKKRE